MQIIILSGGSGKRLWPISNDARSKQFIKLFKNDRGEYESMIQRTYRQVRQVYPDANIVVATSESQVDSIHNQLDDEVHIVVEPERRGTYPAVVLAIAYLAYEKKVNPEEPVLVLPVDSYAGNAYFNLLLEMESAIDMGTYNMVLMGIHPTYPTAKYGYIIPAKEDADKLVKRVERFVEKPNESAARQLIVNGAYWDGGVFGFRLSYVLDRLEEYGLPREYQAVYQNYGRLNRGSFDCEVVEKGEDTAMLSFDGRWKDLGTWNTLAEEMSDDCLGNVMTGEEVYNTTVINELAIPVIALGTQNLIVAASADGILVSDKQKSSYLRPYVESMSSRPMYEERRWGEYQVLDYVRYDDGMKSLTKHMTIRAGKNISYQSHNCRSEVWTVVDGEGELLIEDEIRIVKRGDIINIPEKQRHAIRAIRDIQIVEVQMGSSLEEEDIRRYEWNWGKGE